MFRDKILIESSGSYSSFFIGINDFFKDKENVAISINNNRFVRNFLRYVPNFLIPKLYEMSVTMMPDLYSGIANKNILWVHDALIFEEELIFGDNKDRLRRECESLLEMSRRANLIITPSEYSKKKILEYVDVQPDKIVVQHCLLNGARYDKILHNREYLNYVRKKYELEGKTKNVIFIGSAHYRKNLVTVKKVFQQLKLRIPGVNLFIVSKPREDIPSTYRVYEELGLEANVNFLNRISGDELIALISMCDILLNPTLEEGFGLANIEAQICGTVVISSTKSCIPEVLSNSAILVDPCDDVKLLDACVGVLEGKKDIDELIERGYSNASRFTDISKYEKLYSMIQNEVNERSF